MLDWTGLVAAFDTSAQCRVEALQHVVGSTAIVAYTQAFWTYRALGDPLSVDITRLASVKHYELQESPKTKLRTTQNKQRVCFRQRHGVKIFSRNEILQFNFSYIRPSLSSPSIFSPSLSSPAISAFPFKRLFLKPRAISAAFLSFHCSAHVCSRFLVTICNLHGRPTSGGHSCRHTS